MSAELSAYEIQRAENIRQNNRKLEALGLEGQRPHHVPIVRPTISKRRGPPPAADLRDVRRSLRNAPRVDYAEPRVPAAGTAAAPSSSSDATPQGFPAELGEDEPADAPTAPAVPFIDDRPPADDRTTRAVSVAVPRILERVGQHVPGACTKESVVALLAGGSVPRFSKYLGALEWRNAVSLFVNVGGAEYNNLFLDGGREVTWFAGSRQHGETPIVRRLVGTATSSSTTVLLFCRLVVPVTEPYVCCGRLRHVSHDFRRQPLKFTWRLEDFEALRESPAFGQLLQFK